MGLRFGVRFFGHVANKKSHYLVNNDGDVEPGLRVGSGPELGSGKFPKDVNVGCELLGSMLFPEDEGFDVEVKRWGRKRMR